MTLHIPKPFKIIVVCSSLFINALHGQVDDAAFKPHYFLEVNTGVMCYQTEGTARPANPSSGFVWNMKGSRIVSMELCYSNAWIDETVKKGDYGDFSQRYNTLAHFGSVRLGFGKDYENWSLHGLVGISMMFYPVEKSGLELGGRFTRTISEHLAIHGSIICGKYSMRGYEKEPHNLYPGDPVATPFLFNAQIGIGYHFK